MIFDAGKRGHRNESWKPPRNESHDACVASVERSGAAKADEMVAIDRDSMEHWIDFHDGCIICRY